MSQIESTYKARDVEETIDIYFYRPLGYVVARGSKALGITPNTVTIISIGIGVFGGHLLYYRDFMTNLWGIALWIIADTLDSADGQLARMTNHKSKFGRVLDGFATYVIFTSIYLHLYARMVVTGGSPWLLLLVLASAMSHSVQSALSDYYRNAYLKFVVGAAKSELERSDEVQVSYDAISFRKQPFRKMLLRLHLNYTIEQEALSKNFQMLRKRADEQFGAQIPIWFADEYRRLNKPLMKYYAILTTNTRIIIMAVCVLANFVPLYFLGEVIGINAVMIAVTLYQERLSARLLHQIDARSVTV